MTHHRLLQANMVGAAGLVSMEDAEAIEIVHNQSWHSMPMLDCGSPFAFSRMDRA